MRINRQLNLVVPIYSLDGKTVTAYVHSTPLAEEVVERYFVILGQTYSGVMSSGMGVGAGPGHAMRMLKLISTKMGEWDSRAADGYVGVRDGLIEEMRRGTNVMTMMDGRWTPVPLQVAVDRGMLDGEDRTEVENAIVFFIAVSATLNRTERRKVLEMVCDLWGAQISPLTPSEFASSLPTSNGTGNSGGTAKPATEPADARPKHAAPANAAKDGKPASVPH